MNEAIAFYQTSIIYICTHIFILGMIKKKKNPNCTLNFNIHFPTGYSLEIFKGLSSRDTFFCLQYLSKERKNTINIFKGDFYSCGTKDKRRNSNSLWMAMHMAIYYSTEKWKHELWTRDKNNLSIYKALIRILYQYFSIWTIRHLDL